MTSRNQREGFYCGRFKHMREGISRYHRTTERGLSLKHIYEEPPDEQVERLTNKVLALIKEQDAKQE